MAGKFSKQTEEMMSYAAAKAALGIKGVGSLVSVPIKFSIRSKEIFKGVLMTVNQDELVFDIYINVEYGSKIPQTAFAVQEAVKKSVETISRVEVDKIHIHVQGIDFDY